MEGRAEVHAVVDRQTAEAIELSVNGEQRSVSVADDMPLLWVLRDVLGLTGTKYGCGRGLCGGCTVHVDGRAVRSCVTPAASVEGAQVTTIEGLSSDAGRVLQRMWSQANVPQCGYCQPGQIMSAAALLASTADPSDQQIRAAMAGNLCRCGTYGRIVAAIRLAASEAGGA